MKSRVALMLLLLPAAAFAAGGTVEFNGLLVIDGKAQVSLADTATGATSWVPVGGSFAGYAVSAYDAGTDELVLTKAGQQERVRLKDAVLLEQAAPPAKTQNPTVADAKPATFITNLDPAIVAAAQPPPETSKPAANVANVASIESDKSIGTPNAADGVGSGNITLTDKPPGDGNLTDGPVYVTTIQRRPAPAAAGANLTAPGTSGSSNTATPGNAPNPLAAANRGTQAGNPALNPSPSAPSARGRR